MIFWTLYYNILKFVVYQIRVYPLLLFIKQERKLIQISTKCSMYNRNCNLSPMMLVLSSVYAQSEQHKLILNFENGVSKIYVLQGSCTLRSVEYRVQLYTFRMQGLTYPIYYLYWETCFSSTVHTQSYCRSTSRIKLLNKYEMKFGALFTSLAIPLCKF